MRHGVLAEAEQRRRGVFVGKPAGQLMQTDVIVRPSSSATSSGRGGCIGNWLRISGGRSRLTIRDCRASVAVETMAVSRPSKAWTMSGIR